MITHMLIIIYIVLFMWWRLTVECACLACVFSLFVATVCILLWLVQYHVTLCMQINTKPTERHTAYSALLNICLGLWAVHPVWNAYPCSHHGKCYRQGGNCMALSDIFWGNILHGFEWHLLRWHICQFAYF